MFTCYFVRKNHKSKIKNLKSQMRLDLQIHSCLSPCGDLESSPKKIALAAKTKGLDIIALTDHNTTGNCYAMREVVEKIPGLTAYYGTEVTSSEEVHLICLFGEVETADNFGKFVKRHLPNRKNDPEYFGDQPIVDANENILGFEDAFLVGSTDLSIDSITEKVHSEGGIVIASHVDRPISSIFSQLGLWPDETKIDAADLSINAVDEARWRKLIPIEIPIVRTSDAHFLEDIGRQYTTLEMKSPDFENFKVYLAQSLLTSSD